MKVDATSEALAATLATAQRTISLGKAIAYFAFSLVINSAGNVLTLVTSAKIHPSFLGVSHHGFLDGGLKRCPDASMELETHRR